ncbi:SGNH/GDSL hydrolase family protein [Coraliomargarita parva]|uniref:SGNH/GDSL hydrolase family protein n=1 Tax=Coraliomargarita parva TaxID=3014050 RepID=UPI0022B30B03|nr:GDSL-type esterase/lipase family protein [Coraliomargarita parva]
MTTSLISNLEAGKAQTIAYYGTSLTAHGAWNRLLTAELKARYPGLVTAYNNSGSGKNSKWGLEHLEENVLSKNPDTVFLEFSVNDAVARFKLTPEETKANLNLMIDRILANNPDCEIILQVMNPVIDRPKGHKGWRPTLEACQENYREVAAERGFLLIDYMPAWTELLEKDEATFREYVPDGLHPAENGYRAIVMPILLEKLGLETK